jgi:hypothetical protein
MIVQMGKREHDFNDVVTFKERFRRLSVDQLRKKQAMPALAKAARSAIRQLLTEKEQVQDNAAIHLEEVASMQRTLCDRYGADYVAVASELKVGLARQTLHLQPLNGLRHQPDGDTSGWFLWAGEHLGGHANFFEPIHAIHLAQICPAALPYLGLPPGWRFLIAPGHEDVWFDPSLIVV